MHWSTVSTMAQVRIDALLTRLQSSYVRNDYFGDGYLSKIYYLDQDGL